MLGKIFLIFYLWLCALLSYSFCILTFICMFLDFFADVNVNLLSNGFTVSLCRSRLPIVLFIACLSRLQ